MENKRLSIKGISPLIAAVLLIAFTLAIAGIMATWATTFVRQKTASISSQTECIGSLDAEIKSFNSATGVIGLVVRNLKTSINLTDITIGIEYSSAPYSRSYKLKDLAGGKDPLGALEVSGVDITTTDTRCPDKIRVIASNCPDFPQEKTRIARDIPC